MKEKEAKVGFVLRKIVTEQFAVIDEAYEEGKEVKLNTQIQFSINPDQKMLGVKAVFKFEQTKIPFLLVEASCHFQITEKAWDSFIQEETKAFVVPAGFMCHLSMLTVGTVRGILHAKTENTPFNKYLIPTINVAAMIADDITFDIQKLSAQ